MLTSLVSALPEICLMICAVIPEIVTAIIDALLSAIPQVIQCGIDLLVSLIGALPEIIITLVGAIPTIITSLISAILGNIPLIIEAGLSLFISLIGALPKIIIELVKAVPKIVTSLIGAFGDAIPKFLEMGKQLIQGLWQGIKNAFTSLPDKLGSLCSNLVGKVKNFFGIKSPSKLFKDEIGKNLMLGLAGGIADAGKYAIEATEEAAEDISNVDFKLPDPRKDGNGFDFDGAVSAMRSTTRAVGEANATAVSASTTAGIYGGSSDEGDIDDGEGSGSTPAFIQNDIYIDGKKTARVLTPYIAKEIDWEGK